MTIGRHWEPMGEGWPVTLPGMDPVDSRDLVTALVITKRLGLARTQRVHELVARRTDPMPGHVWAQPRVYLWHWPEVRDWAATQDLDVFEPGTRVPAAAAAARLEVPASQLQTDVDGLVLWESAEQVWIDSTMNVHRD